MATVSNKQYEQKMDVFVGNISKYMKTTHTSREQMAAFLGIKPRTWDDKLKEPYRFKLDEIIRITNKLGFDGDSCKEIFCFK